MFVTYITVTTNFVLMISKIGVRKMSITNI